MFDRCAVCDRYEKFKELLNFFERNERNSLIISNLISNSFTDRKGPKMNNTASGIVISQKLLAQNEDILAAIGKSSLYLPSRSITLLQSGKFTDWSTG
jgi:hypothetical protein